MRIYLLYFILTFHEQGRVGHESRVKFYIFIFSLVNLPAKYMLNDKSDFFFSSKHRNIILRGNPILIFHFHHQYYFLVVEKLREQKQRTLDSHRTIP